MADFDVISFWIPLFFAVPITLPQVSWNFTKLHFIDAKIILDDTWVLFIAQKSKTRQIFALKVKMFESLFKPIIALKMISVLVNNQQLQNSVKCKYLQSLMWGCMIKANYISKVKNHPTFYETITTIKFSAVYDRRLLHFRRNNRWLSQNR